MPGVGLKRPAGTVFSQLRCNADGGREREILLEVPQVAGLCIVGPLESVMVSGHSLQALYNLLPYGQWALDVTEIFGGLVVGQVTVVLLYHHSLRYWIPFVSLLALLVCSIFFEEILCIHAQ